MPCPALTAASRVRSLDTCWTSTALRLPIAVVSLVALLMLLAGPRVAYATVCCDLLGNCFPPIMGSCLGGVAVSGNTCSPNPCIAACCSPLGSCSLSSSAFCQATPGAVFRGYGSTCASSVCGVCCSLATGSCSVGGSSGCAGSDQFMGINSTCTTGLCTGACCNSITGACTITAAQGCPGGAFGSLNTTCTSGACGVCCSPTTGACSVAGAGGCAGTDQFMGISSTCTSGLCTGACCNRWTGNCVVESPLICANHGLRFDGLGAACSPATCKACPADFNGTDGPTVADIFAFLTAWFAGCP